MIWKALLVFLSVAIADVAWTRYNMSVTAKHATFAANWSVAIILLGAVSFFGYIESRWMIVPSALGAWVGTYIAMKVKP